MFQRRFIKSLTCILLIGVCTFTFAIDKSLVRVKLYVKENEATRIAQAVTDLIFISPDMRLIKDPKQPYYALEIKHLDDDKAIIIATALRERLQLFAQVIPESSNKPIAKKVVSNRKTKPIRIANAPSRTSVVQLPIKKKADYADDNFADTPSHEKTDPEKTQTAEDITEKAQELTPPTNETKAPSTKVASTEKTTASTANKESKKVTKVLAKAPITNAPTQAAQTKPEMAQPTSEKRISPEPQKVASEIAKALPKSDAVQLPNETSDTAVKMAEQKIKAFQKPPSKPTPIPQKLPGPKKTTQKNSAPAPQPLDPKLANINQALTPTKKVKSTAVEMAQPFIPDTLKQAKVESEQPQPEQSPPYSRTVKPKKAQPQQVKHLWNAKDADIRSVISTVSEFTGKNFIIDPRVQGKVTIISKTPLTGDEIYAAFLSALQVNGFSTVDTDEAIKIVPTIEAKSMDSQVADNAPVKRPGDSYLVRVVSLKHVPVQQLIPVLRPLMPQWASLSTYMPSNKIILTGRKSNLDKLVKIIEEIDTDHLQRVSVIPIQYGMAEEIAKTLRSLYTGFDSFAHKVSIASDDYSNSILVSGAPADRARIRELIQELDNPSTVSHKTSTQVIYLKYLQAKDLVPILAGVAKSMFSGRVGTTIGSMSIENAERISIEDGSTTSSSSSNNGNKDVTASTKSEEAKGESGRSVEIIAEPNTNSIIINGPPNVLMTLRHVLRQIDIRPSQVIIEALIAEIDENDVAELGIDWGSVSNIVDNAKDRLTGFTQNIGIVTNHGFRDFQAILRAKAEDDKANILSTPSIMVLDNHKAHIAVGKQVSVENSQFNTTNNGLTSTFAPQKVALALDVTPQINQGDTIRLLISHANNSLQNENDTSGRPVINLNEINTSVIVNNGDVLVLGGLIKNQINHNDNSIPILGQLPLIGRAFHKKNNSITKKKLMVFLHPIIIKSKNDNKFYSNNQYDNFRESQLAFMRRFAFHPENKEYVLPKVKPKDLPRPFEPVGYK